MKKLTLDLDAVSVQSFAVTAERTGDAGTVLAREAVFAPSYIDWTRCATDCTCPDTR
ncbi:hypothetical protein [Longimicrobium terrae]|uniref:Uncharacterized protein n=1 Tax=Longimicrobium terrae TaxID=1639882 RepID=A0A841H203_9BACT|nr:hypothetical protein [Longimicrobium terrae]MBB4637626.1 hypothetical protein [Longimicrobium terrae]MBB6072023.1 hypothetical protein [Longimicrobium terrae]NNC29890.1 hypothetical protein [Longimicrobium terrae]